MTGQHTRGITYQNIGLVVCALSARITITKATIYGSSPMRHTLIYDEERAHRVSFDSWPRGCAEHISHARPACLAFPPRLGAEL